MRKVGLEALRCPVDWEKLSVERASRHEDDELIEGELVCGEGHLWIVSDGIPSLVDMNEVSEDDLRWIRQYDEHAEEYDQKIKLYDVLLKTNMMREREKLMGILPLKDGSRIVDISVGTAANFMAMYKVNPDQTTSALLYGIELSRGMLKVARRKLEARGLNYVLVHADTNKNYPFPENYFDIVLNTGGINTHSDIPFVFSDMLRICRPSGTILVFDEGMSPEQKKTEFGQSVISQNRLFDCEPPLDKIPKEVDDLKQWWIMNDTFYTITFRKRMS